MKNLLIAFSTAVLLSLPAAAQEDVSMSSAQPEVVSSVRFDNVQLEQMLGPIALYPDALIALILPAATMPSDIVLAARYLRDGGDPALIDNQTWDDSVRALARYPDVIKWMDENLAWTKQLGEAFIAQPTEVMNAMQRLRLKARSVGSLVDTPQQQVVVENSTIAIVPAQPDVIYVPYYDPEVVYVSRPTYYTRPFFSFSPAYASGFWLSYNVDWHRRRVWCVDRPHRETHWREHRHDWHRPSHSRRVDFTHRPNYYRAWTPRPVYNRPGHVNRSYDRPVVVRPRHHGGRSDGHSYRDEPRSNASRWDRNYTRPAHATGERFPNAPQGLNVPRTSPTSHSLPLANPLPHTIPSPLPSAQPARDHHASHERISGQRGHEFRDRGIRSDRDRSDRSDGSVRNDRGMRSERGRNDRAQSDHRRFEPGPQHRAHVAPPAAAPSPASSHINAQPGRVGFQPRTHSARSSGYTPPAASTAHVSPAPAAADQPATASRSSEYRSQDHGHGSHGRGVGRRSNER